MDLKKMLNDNQKVQDYLGGKITLQELNDEGISLSTPVIPVEYIAEIDNHLKSLNRNYPDRRKKIHREPCKPCPSHNNMINGIIDPESEDIKKLPKEIIAKEYLFVCFMRQNKLCKGLCDHMGIDEGFLNNLE